MQTIGFVGLGMMGLPMLENLASRLSATILACDADDAPFETLKTHPAWGRTLRRAAIVDMADCEAVITMLPNSRITNAVMLGGEGAKGLIDVLAPGAVLIDMGSSNPPDTQNLAQACAARGLRLVDAPVSGAVVKARNGTLAIMAGGEAADVARVRPLLETMGATLIATGAVGSAHAIKALNNYVYAAGLMAVCEALAIAQRMSLDPQVLTEVLNASSGRNVASETKLAQFIIPETYAGGFALGLMSKDLDTASGLQAHAGVNAPQLSLCARRWREARETLPAGADNTEIFRLVRDGALAGRNA